MRGPPGTPYETAAEMHALYQRGLNMREIAPRFGLGRTGVQKAFARYEFKVRSRGGPQARLPQAEPPLIIIRPSFQPPRSWCAQCERRVSTMEAGRCASRFCAAKHFAVGLDISAHEADKARARA